MTSSDGPGNQAGGRYPQGADRAPWFLVEEGWAVGWDKPPRGGYRITVTRTRKGARCRRSARGRTMQQAWGKLRGKLAADEGVPGALRAAGHSPAPGIRGSRA